MSPSSRKVIRTVRPFNKGKEHLFHHLLVHLYPEIKVGTLDRVSRISELDLHSLITVCHKEVTRFLHVLSVVESIQESVVKARRVALGVDKRTQVPRANIRFAVDPVEYFRVSGEPLCIPRDSFYGPIKDSRTDNLFAQIRVIDLSSNGFSGDLPASRFENFEAMKMIDESSGIREYVGNIYSYYYTNSLTVTTKGLDLELPRVLTTDMLIDLSRNRFEGHIPSIIGDLIGLRTLNLSDNRLEGIIPASLHQLSVLESLDLSSNKISGEIPQQLASLKSLEVLNLSHNHLAGCIPKGKQFDTFENSSY
ncbi:receptor-like protein 9DC1 [Solanum verrucosum]|uniref:receptor-like protein 9DC1 n=1 Tax=Solanum verrucosum TaxID=315347 RepID=UPI0020D1BDE1|nr:receptor-like protein 9DC1 [Solanum verrucosum]